jgi:hypothetical protein
LEQSSKGLTTVCGPGWNVTVYVSTSRGNFSDFRWDLSGQNVANNVVVQYLSFHNDFAEAFPGTPVDDFALVAIGNITVSAGYHQFCTTSHDGSWLFVDGRLLVSNNHYWYMYMYPACQNIQLSEGIHTITVNYYKQHANRTGSTAALEVSMDGSLIDLNGKAPYIVFFGGLGG